MLGTGAGIQYMLKGLVAVVIVVVVVLGATKGNAGPPALHSCSNWIVFCFFLSYQFMQHSIRLYCRECSVSSK